ncbi:MAG: Glycerophosphoryl diester phosphodiesterase [uncultured Rubrobacteraceae bacterium]|uniref:Glycerophosphoryl diester phosphodiesterase n=1 Tax=uncultured Rubrobacteraceae bacterium TaxID=349277 RepID=A0A6J4QQB7_9ACTN|nr:MAG: Glycerophosphoryl diester phosphodiesterase [uncultured Rubrobacteraceae bacterium]
MTLNVGHRGAAGLEPENTLRSFRRAAEEGADAVELDLRLTRDGCLAVLHDADVDRTTNGSGPVAEMTLNELKRLDAGLGERVPTFEEVLEAIELPIHAELKVVEAAEPLATSILERGLAGRVVPISFHPEALRQTKRSLPNLPVGLILRGTVPNPAAEARSVDATYVSLEAAYLDEETVEHCQRAGLRVTTWTVNEPEEMRRALETGVDGIVTDRPDLLAGLAGHLRSAYRVDPYV